MTDNKNALSFAIEGGRKLKGEITVNTSKNGAMAVLCASLLNRGTTTVHHVPKIEEVHRLVEVFESIGVKALRQVGVLLRSWAHDARLLFLYLKAKRTRQPLRRFSTC
jgi:UDP-N-acetylglucosamine enolpyruvyl transferase